jgi:predicted nucleic acid-binding protein
MRCVDTDFLIDVLTEEYGVLELVNDLDDSKEYFTTSISAFELLSGAYQLGKARLNAAKKLLSRFHIFEFDGNASDESGKIYADLRKKGREIPMRDAMIAGIVMVNGCSLVTRNTQHFKRVPKLKLISW